MKKLFDFLVAAILIIALLPVFLVAALTIKIFSKGPLLFTQERIGYQAKPFRIFKFRTMRVDTEKTQTGSVTIKNDPRFFPFALLLRKFKIDELPQLFNVLNGTMSLVGPRPTVKEDYDKMNLEQRRRFDVTPGLTGMAQVNGNTSLTWPERIQHDLDYIDRQSIFLDIALIVKSGMLILAGRADTDPPGDDEWTHEAQQ